MAFRKTSKKIQISIGLDIQMHLPLAISTTRVLLSSLYEFCCFTGILSLKCTNRPSGKLSLSYVNILHPAKWNWLLGKELSILIFDIKNISNVLQMKGLSHSNLFLIEFVFRWPSHFSDFQIKMTLFLKGSFNSNC